MATQFYDVFSELKLNEELEHLFGDVEIVRVGRVQSKELLRIYILSHRLITKERIFQVEGEIKKQYFPGKNLKIKLMEKFQLSGQYTPKNLMSAYWDSILLEFREYSMLEYDMLRTAKISFSGEEEEVIDFAVAASCLKQTVEGDYNRTTVQEIEQLICQGGNGRIQR